MLHFSIEEKQILVDECKKSINPDLFDIVSFALLTGARRGEIQNLKWQDINFENNIITFEDTKNGIDRAVPMAVALKSILLNRSLNQQSEKAYVFC